MDSTEKSIEITLKEIEVTKLDLKPNDILCVTIKDDYIEEEVLQYIRQSLEKSFKNNKIYLFGVNSNSEIKFQIMSDSSSVLPVKDCSTQSYCSDCSCGKKEQYKSNSESGN